MSFFKPYKQLGRHIYYLIGAEFLIQCINATFLVLMNYYLLEIGYKDYQIAEFTSYRYISVLLLGVPFGFIYKRINLLPLIKIGTILFIANAIAIVYLAPTHHPVVMPLLMFCFGIFLLMSHVVALPFLLKIVEEENLSISLSLFFQTWATAIMSVGLVSFIFKHFFTDINSEKNIILFILFMSSIAILLLFKIPKNVELLSSDIDSIVENKLSREELKRILMILVPTFIIAIGAGFSIPFFNLFFHFTYQMTAESYSIIVGLSHGIVILFMMFTPWIKQKFGYQFGVIGIQTMGIICLIIMTWANYFFSFETAFILAVGFFILRQPLMNSAGPIIAEYTLEIVGRKNQPLLGSIEATIWSGSFWVSSLIFSELRKMNLTYSNIFNITIVLYIIGVCCWIFVFRYFRNQKNPSEISIE